MAAESDEIISVNSNNKNNSLTINGKIESVTTNKNINSNNNNNSRERVNNIINSNNNGNNDTYNSQHNNNNINDNDVEDEVACAITHQIHINNRRRENPPPNYYSELSEHRTIQVDDHDDGLGPLPIKWEKAYTESGEVYFIDHNTGTSHWLDPRLSKFQKKSLEDCLDDELPYGWEKIHDPQYGTYFIDHVNRRTQYENPVLEAKRRVESNLHNNSNGNSIMGNKSLKLKSSSLTNVDRDKSGSSTNALSSIFTRNPSELCGERITTTLLKSSRGLGFTIVGADDDNIEEFLQIKLIVPNGPAWLDGKLKTGDILVYVNDICVLGFSHHEMVNVFQSIMSGETVTLEICRGYPLPFDPNDPNTDIVTTIAVDGLNTLPHMDLDTINRKKMDGNYNFLDISDPIQHQQQKNPLSKIHSGLVNNNSNNINNNNHINENNLKLDNNNILSICIVKGIMGFGFTIADSVNGQKVKKILDRQCCKNLIEGDLLLQINKVNVKNMSHSDVVQVLKDCPKNQEAVLKVQRFIYFNNNNNNNSNNTENKKKLINNKLNDNNNILNNKNKSKDNLLYRSKTPTADLYSTQQKEILPIRPKTPLIDTRIHTKTPSIELITETNDDLLLLDKNLLLNDSKQQQQSQQNQQQQQLDTKSINSYPDHDSINNDIFPKNLLNITERLKDTILTDNDMNYEHHQQQQQLHQHLQQQQQHNLQQQHHQRQKIMSNRDFYNFKQQQHHQQQLQILAPVPTYHQDSCFCYECQDYARNQHQQQMQQHEYGANVNIMQPIPHHVYQQYGQHHQQHQQHINGRMGKKVNEYFADRKKSVFSPLENPHNQILLSSATSPPYWTTYGYGQQLSPNSNLSQQHDEYILSEVTLERQSLGFGFRIVGGTEEGSQVTVGHIVPGGSADSDPRITTGDEILSIDGVNVVNSSHHRVVQLMGEAGIRGQVTMILRRKKHTMHSLASPPLPPALPQMTSMPMYYQQQQQQMIAYPYDVIVSRNENEGFGFVIISSSSQFYGSTIGKLIPGSPADRCGDLKVGDRIIAVNRIDIAGMSHGDVVNLIKESGLHVRLSIGAPSQHQQSQQPPLPPPPQLPLTPNSEPLLSGIAALQQQQNQTYLNQSQQQQQPPPQL